MALNNPAFNRNPAFRPGKDGAQAAQAQAATASATSLATVEGMQQLYDAPSATAVDTDRMSYEDTIGKTVFLFVVLLAAALVGWLFPVVTFPAALVGLGLGLV